MERSQSSGLPMKANELIATIRGILGTQESSIETRR
jgi:hypothetical protein